MKALARGIYRLLLFTYPKSFREEFGAVMAADFNELLDEGDRASARFLAVGHDLGNVALNGIRERLRHNAATHRPLRTRNNGERRTGSQRGTETMRRLLNDVKHALRGIGRNPAFAATVVIMLALGIGANTAIFSVVNGLLLRPLPYPEPAELVTINHVYPSHNLVAGVSAPGYRDYRDRTRSFERVAIETGWTANLTGSGNPVRVSGGRVTAGFFETYGVTPVIGRSFRTQEDAPGAGDVVVISDGFWRRRLGGAAGVVGTSILLNAQSYQVVGILPPGFEDFFNRAREFWVPLALPPEAFSDDFRIRESYRLVARLQPDTPPATAAAEMTTLAETIKAELPDAYPPNWTLRVTSLDEREKGGYRATLLLLFGAVGFVLLITCANVANLLLAKGIGRQREVAIRSALGASRGQLVGQFLTESIVLAMLGGVAGLFVAGWGIRAIVAVGPDVLTRTEIGIDNSVLLFTLLISLVVGVLFGLAPALQGTHLDIQRRLREGGRTSVSDRSAHRLRQSLVVAEFALALILLTGSGLMIQSVARLSQVDPGFTPDRLLAASIRIPDAKYADRDSRVAFFDRLLDELTAVPGITASATTSVIPFSGDWGTSIFTIEGYVPGENDPAPWGDMRFVSPTFARTLDVPLLSGRFFDERDGPASPPAVVVDEEMVRRFWPDEPLGKRITFDDPQSDTATWMTVIGTVGHLAYEGLDAERRVQLYFSSRQFPNTGTGLLIRTEREPESMVPAVRQAVFSVDADQPISNVEVMEDLMTESMGNSRLLMLLLTLFSGLAMLLASLGIYGVMAHMVRERSGEMGLRMALGATRPTLFGLVMKKGIRLAGLGLALGIAGALALARLLQSQLYGIGAFDPPTLGGVTLVLLILAAAAAGIPANRAARVDPMVNLRTE